MKRKLLETDYVTTKVTRISTEKGDIIRLELVGEDIIAATIDIAPEDLMEVELNWVNGYFNVLTDLSQQHIN